MALNLSQMNPIHNLETYVSKILFNNFFPFTPTYFEWSLLFRHPKQNFAGIPPLHTDATCTAHLILRD
jgi:hypothetical protein